MGLTGSDGNLKERKSDEIICEGAFAAAQVESPAPEGGEGAFFFKSCVLNSQKWLAS